MVSPDRSAENCSLPRATTVRQQPFTPMLFETASAGVTLGAWMVTRPLPRFQIESLDCAKMFDDSREHNFLLIAREMPAHESTAFRHAGRKHYTEVERITQFI